MKFTQEKKTEWINWLRDNPDLQGKGSLKDKQGKYCCLGGYCLLNADKVFGHFEKQEDSGISFFVIDIRQYEAFLPFDLEINWMSNPRIIFGSYVNTSRISISDDRTFHSYNLSELNDDGFTFSQIADLIEFFISPDL